MKIRIGTRGSPLALAQTKLVEEILKKNYKYINIERVIIKTQGDISNKPLSELSGDGFFTKAIENALIEDKINLCVHSAKDLPTNSYSGIEYYAVGSRADYSDTLLLKKKSKPIIGTSSKRRELQIKDLLPDAIIKPIRGNIETRIKKVVDGQYDGVIIATAALNRLNLKLPKDFSRQVLNFATAPGQGILAIQVKQAFKKKIEKIINKDLDEILKFEKKFLTYLGGGCNLPLGCNIKNKNLNLYFYSSKDNLKVQYKTKATNLETLFQKGIEQFYKNKSGYVWITSPIQRQLSVSLRLNNLPVCFPLIEVVPLLFENGLKECLNYDCVIFPSNVAIDFTSKLKFNCPIFCMGETSKSFLNELGYSDVSIIDDFRIFEKYKSPLLLSAKKSLVANRLDKLNLKYKHIKVYKTQSVIWGKLPHIPNEKDSIIFTSPSTVESFAKNLKKFPELKKLKRFALGKTTFDKLKSFGLDSCKFEFQKYQKKNR